MELENDPPLFAFFLEINVGGTFVETFVFLFLKLFMIFGRNCVFYTLKLHVCFTLHTKQMDAWKMSRQVQTRCLYNQGV